MVISLFLRLLLLPLRLLLIISYILFLPLLLLFLLPPLFSFSSLFLSLTGMMLLLGKHQFIISSIDDASAANISLPIESAKNRPPLGKKISSSMVRTYVISYFLLLELIGAIQPEGSANRAY